MSFTTRFVGACALGLALAAPAAAQSGTVAPTASMVSTHTVVTEGTAIIRPTPSAARLAAPVDVAPTLAARLTIDEAANAMHARRARGEGETLMIVGGVGILAGVLLEEGFVSVVGAVVGLYGLYLYLR